MADERWKYLPLTDPNLSTTPSPYGNVQTEYGLINPFEGMAMPSLPANAGNTALNLAGILGGLGLGFVRPNIGAQALNNFQAANMLQWREDQKEFSRQRLALQKQDQAMQLATLAEMQRGEGGTAPSGQPPFAAAAPQAAAPFTPPSISAVPHFEAAPVESLGGTPQFLPQARMAEQPLQPFFTDQPAPIRGNISTSLSAFGRSQTRSTNRGTEKEQDTTTAINELANAWIQNPDAAQREPRRLLKEVLDRHKMADSKEVRQSLSNTLVEVYHNEVLKNNPGLDPKSAFREAYKAAGSDLGPGMFLPTDQMRTLATSVASVEEQRGLATGQDDRQRLEQLNIYKGREGLHVPFTPAEAQKFEVPPRVGTTPAMQAGITAPMSAERQVGLESRERERSQTQIALETVAPTISSIVRKAEDVRKSFSDIGDKSWYQRGVNWVDLLQSQVTNFPATEVGKLAQSYDTMVQTSAPLIARAYQGQKGNLTESERLIGQDGVPKKFIELYNNPVAGNDRLAVMSDILALELRDPTFRLDRLDVPMSEFEKGVEAHRQQRMATRPELYTNAPRLSPTQSPTARPTAPPTLAAPPLTPEDQAIKDRINQEINDYLKRRP